MLRTRLEHHLNNHTSEKELRDALDMFICYNVPDNGEKKKAEEKLKQYWEIKKGKTTHKQLLLFSPFSSSVFSSSCFAK